MKHAYVSNGMPETELGKLPEIWFDSKSSSLTCIDTRVSSNCAHPTNTACTRMQQF
jgi:hypothetical protein